MTTSRRTLLTGAAGSALALALAACSGGDGAVVRSATTSGATSGASSSAAGTTTVGLTYIPNVQFAPFYVGIKEGFFTSRGANVEVRHHGANEGLFTALSSGQEQLLIASGDELVEARANGLDVVAVASYYRRYPVVLIVPEASPIRSGADLKGRRLGVPGRYGASWLGALAMFKDAGLTDKDVDVKEIGYTSQAALATGKVDAVMGFSNNDLVQLGLGGVKVRAVPLTRSGQVPLVSISLVTTGEYLRKHPDTVKAVADGMLDGIQTMKDDPDKTLKDTAAFVPNLAEEKAMAAARATLEATVPIMLQDGVVTGRLDPTRWESMVTFMKQQGLVTKDVPVAQAIDTGRVSR